ncbi:uncharacterized J domain-containing protein C4H3.01 [Cryptomeria japonica]|uniref:uncharacterized J domain-containing protein C4H3.01 n=1 Tax=Cryptomeria japonica TaxID=3369 RepID=UPI0027D9F9B5|nr:uncharacterized J domain-containing protein C4H3.01 [Cryptomeria japonica]
MAAFRAVCRPHMVASLICCTRQLTFHFKTRPAKFRPISFLPSLHHNRQRSEFGFRLNTRGISTEASAWNSQRSPYETLELDRDVDEEVIKASYRRLAKHYHPDVYDGTGDLEEGETAETRFIKIQAAYELLMDKEQRMKYDKDNRVNPIKASRAWMEWVMKKKKAFERRGDMAVTAWAEQQQLELNLRVRQLSRTKTDPEEERKILAREKRASMVNFTSTMKRHALVLKKRDLMRKKAEEDQNKIFKQLLASEGLELDIEEDDKT